MLSEKRKEYNKKYYEKNKEKASKRFKEYYENNKEAISKKKEEWRKEHPDYMKEYYKNNKETILDQQREYRRTTGKDMEYLNFWMGKQDVLRVNDDILIDREIAEIEIRIKYRGSHID